MGSLILAVGLLGSPNLQMRMILPKSAARADFFRDAILTQRYFLAQSKVMLAEAYDDLKQRDIEIKLLQEKRYPQQVIDKSMKGREGVLRHIENLKASIARSEQFLRDWNKPRPK